MSKRRRLQFGDFGQVLSGYVDPTPEGLDMAYQRHMDNLLTSEEIRRLAANLKVAPFENDANMRRDLLSTSDDALQKIVSQASYGNLSNFTAAVQRASTEYQKRAAPLEENNKRYTEYKASVDKLLEEKKIDPQDATGAMMLSNMAYGSGLSYDEAGNPNYFQGVQVWQNPEIEKMINKALSEVEPDAWREVRRTLAVGPDGSRTVETDQGQKYISAEKVAMALQGVFNDPRVLGYYGRKGEIDTAMMSDDEVKGAIAGMIDAQSQREQPNVQEVGRLQQLLTSGDMGDMRKEMVSTMRNKYLEPYRTAAIGGKQSMDEWSYVKEYWDKKYLIDYKNQLDNAVGGPTGLVITEEGMKYNKMGGENAAELYVAIEDKENQLTELKELYESQKDQMSPEGVANLEQQIANLNREIAAQHNIFMGLYNIDASEIAGMDEYKQLTKDVKEAEAELLLIQNNPRRDYVNMILGMDAFPSKVKLWRAQKRLRDFVKDMDLPNPTGGRGTISPEFVNPVELGAPSVVPAEIKAYFSGGFYERMPVLTPSGELKLLGELDDFSPDWKFTGATISKNSPIGLGPMLRIGYAKEDGTAGSFITPLNATKPGVDGYLDIPALNSFYNSPAMRILTEFTSYRENGLPNMTFNYVGAGGMTGTMDVNFGTPEGGTVTIKDSEGKVLSTKGLEDPGFLQDLNNYGITLI